MWYFSTEWKNDSTDAHAHAHARANANARANAHANAEAEVNTKIIPRASIPNVWLKLLGKLTFRNGKMQAILAFLDDLSEEECVNTRDKIIFEFGQTTYDYVIQFPIVLQSMPAMTLPSVIYDYTPSHMQQLYCRSQIRQIESYCQFRDLAVIVRDEQLSAGTAYDPATVKPLSWANIASVV